MKFNDIGARVTVAVTIDGRVHEVECTVAEHPRGTCWEVDIESLRDALERAADRELMEVRHAAE